MSTTHRLHTEQLFHDHQAAGRRAFFAAYPEHLQLNDDRYLDHETWIRPAFDLLGNVDGRDVLDYGCGHGMASVVLARRGAKVTAFDLSPLYLEEARERAGVNGVSEQVAFVQAAGEQLPFANASFDAVWGNAILHHLHLPMAAAELARVIKPGGVAVFCEPWGENPLLDWARRRLPYPGKDRSPDEQPLRRRDVSELRRHFAQINVYPFQLLGMARRLWPASQRPATLPLLRALDRCDAAALRRWPALLRMCRYVVLWLRR
jgi:SAM-dependent methyltransferase